MEFTGERMIPECNKGQDIYLQHIARYRFASKVVAGKRVLDIACGSGYGSNLMIEAGADSVVGVDISEEAVTYCCETYKKENLTFLQGSVAEIPIEDDSIDVLVSFETIEHVPEDVQLKFMREVKRVLKKDGMLIVSTPNILVYPKGNPHHLKELTPEEFSFLLKENFKFSEIFYQDDIEASYIFSEKQLKKSDGICVTTEVIEDISSMESMYLVAVCSDNKIEGSFGSVSLSSMKPFEAHLRYENIIRRQDTELQKKDIEIRDLNERLNGFIYNVSIFKVLKKRMYLLYKKYIKRFIPKPLFIAMHFVQIPLRWGCVIVKKYFVLSRLAWEEYRRSGFEGLLFALRRHVKKKRGKLLVGYPTVHDYEKGLVTVAILSKDGYDLIKPCIESIEACRGKRRVEILIGDTGTRDKRVLSWYRKMRRRYKNIRVIRLGEYFFSKNYNTLLGTYARGEFVILLNNDTVVKPGWLDALIAPLEYKKIGVVGAKLLNRDGTLQHAGIEFNAEGNGYHRYRNEPADLPEANVASLVPAVTFACVAMRHDVYDRFQLSEDFREEAQDTDFCLRLREAGFDVLYESKAELFHFEGSSRDWQKGEKDRVRFREVWGNQVEKIVQLSQQRVPFDVDRYRDAIVVIRDDGIGDLLMGISAFWKLRKKNPDKKIILLTYERNVSMMEGFGIFDEVLPIPNGKKYAPLPIPTRGTTIYDLIDFEMRFGGSFAVTKEDNKLTRNVVFSRKFEVEEEYIPVALPEYKEAHHRIIEVLHSLGVPEDSPFVVLSLVASNPARSWWEPFYSVLIRAVQEMGFVPLIVGTKDSPYFSGEGIVNLVGKTKTITEYIEAVKLGKYVISTDTSACHVAGLSGIPFLAIFTGGVPFSARLGYYEKYEALEPEGLACFPCWDEGCKDLTLRHKKEPCRLMLTPEKVIEKLKILAKNNP